LSHCNLSEPKTLKGVLSILQKYLINVKEVDLSYNKFSTNCWKFIEQLAEKLDHLILVACPIASVDSTSHFKEMDNALLGKLIIVPKEWVKRGNWKVCFQESQMAFVEANHNKYYYNKKKY